MHSGRLTILSNSFTYLGDLEGSTGLKVIHQKHPEVFVTSGIMERSRSSAAAGFGFDRDKFGVFDVQRLLGDGFDEMADNTATLVSSFNNMFADNGLSDVESFLYFPADAAQMTAVPTRFLRVRSPFCLLDPFQSSLHPQKPGSNDRFYGLDYKFVKGRGDKEGLDVGLINKPTLNIVDKQTIEIGQSPFVLVMESFNQETGLGARFGTWFLAYTQ
ncbi:hypothetical protein K435DRAFT_789113 [Dendrothele bispora CBS 962.96]|uniref:Uncharacterized protein n=1 Tax=Dendrothele bispora (strain CBS 962.96) TaxID=1314807 RepID=A0A4V4HII0_DENBC|nr:hypothetical protein K435DRAFT_789113 [Dendrothele bispora CBS 962.96]